MACNFLEMAAVLGFVLLSLRIGDASLSSSFRLPLLNVSSENSMLNVSPVDFYSLLDVGPIDPTAEPIIKKGNCSRAFTKFSDAVVKFTNCSVRHARPVRLCMECSDDYNATIQAYNVLREQESDCLEYFFRSDQLAIVDIVFNGASSLWVKSFCPNCYAYYDDSVSFFNASADMFDCLKNFNDSSPFSPNSTCARCRDAYAKVSDTYNRFVHHKSEFNGGICMDIVDSMNITRRLWKEFNCVVEFNTSIGSSNVITTLVFGSLPLLFYLLAKNVSRIEDVKIVQPKRKFTTMTPPAQPPPELY